MTTSTSSDGGTTTPPRLSVSQLNRQAKSLLESQFGFIWVEGEISNFACPSSGHWYFSLKDAKAQVRCAMFRNRNQRLRFVPRNGDAVQLRARVSLYEGRGEFQLIVEHLEPAGAGALQAAFERLKERLAAEGLFAEERKQPLPDHIEHLGVITSPTGAALHDILSVLERRAPSQQVSILPVAVQGEHAAPQIAQAIADANRWQSEGKIALDALIVGRGGGSLEDLWAFNEEIVARAIAASDIPIVSAVGHEVDVSIADMAADYRAPTPSAAAELLSRDERELAQEFYSYESYLHSIMARILADKQLRLTHLRQRLRHPGAALREQAQRLDDLEQRLLLAQKHRLATKRNQLALVDNRLQARSPAERLTRLQQTLDNHRRRLRERTQLKLSKARDQLAHSAALLESLSPLAILQRGYAVIQTPQGRVVRRADQVRTGDTIHARLGKGELRAEVREVLLTKENEKG